MREIIVVPFAHLDEALTAGAPFNAVAIELGTRGRFWASDIVQAAEALRTAISKIRDGQTLILSIGGYDDDPRELPEIPEVVQFLGRVLKQVGITHWGHPAVRMFNEVTLAWVLQCGVLGKDHPFRIQRTTTDETDFFQRHVWGSGA